MIRGWRGAQPHGAPRTGPIRAQIAAPRARAHALSGAPWAWGRARRGESARLWPRSPDKESARAIFSLRRGALAPHPALRFDLDRAQEKTAVARGIESPRELGGRGACQLDADFLPLLSRRARAPARSGTQRGCDGSSRVQSPRLAGGSCCGVAARAARKPKSAP